MIRSSRVAVDVHVAPDPRRVPAGVVAGLTLMALAFGLDLVAHGASLESVEQVAHLTGVLGMVLTWSAVVLDGLRNTARRA